MGYIEFYKELIFRDDCLGLYKIIWLEVKN